MAGGDQHFTNLFACAVGPTSTGRKGSATGPVEMFFTKGDRSPGLGNMLPSLASGEGLIWSIRDEVRGKVYDKKTRQYEEVVIHAGILKALRAAVNGLTRTEIRDFFHRKKQENEITRALYLLHQKGLARFEKEDTGGRPAERWFATSGAAATKGG